MKRVKNLAFVVLFLLGCGRMTEAYLASATTCVTSNCGTHGSCTIDLVNKYSGCDASDACPTDTNPDNKCYWRAGYCSADHTLPCFVQFCLPCQTGL